MTIRSDGAGAPPRPLGAGPSRAPASPPEGLAFATLPVEMRRALRASQMGESVAVAIYSGVSAATRDPAVLAFAASHRAVEARHLALLCALVPASERSWLLRPLRLGGWLMGYLPGRRSAAAFFSVVAAVEAWVDEHYRHQMALSRRTGAPPALTGILDAIRSDEADHSRDASDLGGDPSAVDAWLGRMAVLLSRAGVSVAGRF